MSHDPSVLPAGLPAPVDDGAADLLPGRVLPDIALPATTGGPVDLRRHGAGKRLVVSAHPRTGRPGVDPPTGWDEIPGAAPALPRRAPPATSPRSSRPCTWRCSASRPRTPTTSSRPPPDCTCPMRRHHGRRRPAG